MPINTSESNIAPLDAQILVPLTQCQWIEKTVNGVVQCPHKAWGDTGLCYPHYQKTKTAKSSRIYATVLPNSLESIYKRYKDDVDILDLRPELAVLKTALMQVLRELRADLKTDGQRFGTKGNLEKILSVIKSIQSLASEVAKLEQERHYRIDIRQAEKFVQNVTNVVLVYVEDPEKRKNLMADMRAIPFCIESSKSEAIPMTFNG